MLLPGRLRQTTLGDLLGALHRAGVQGTLELAEDLGRTHRVHLSDGMVVAVEFDGATPTLAETLRASGDVDDATLRRSLLRAISARRLHGEVLIREFHVSDAVVDGAVRRQMLARLARIDQLADARVHFRVTVKPPRGAVVSLPLVPNQFLAGRRRYRDRGQPKPAASRPAPQTRRRPPPSLAPQPPRDASPWRVLGVEPGADTTEIKRAYRRLARVYHPDLHPDASRQELEELRARFHAVTTAYRSLVA
jgi:DnaJ-domain-containing protein 1